MLVQFKIYSSINDGKLSWSRDSKAGSKYIATIISQDGMVLCWNVGFAFQQICFSFKPKRSILLSSVHRTFFQKPCGLLQTTWTAILFWEVATFFLQSCCTIVVQCSLDSSLMNAGIHQYKTGLRCFPGVETSWKITHLALAESLVGQSFLGRLAHFYTILFNNDW